VGTSPNIIPIIYPLPKTASPPLQKNDIEMIHVRPIHHSLVTALCGWFRSTERRHWGMWCPSCDKPIKYIGLMQ